MESGRLIFSSAATCRAAGGGGGGGQMMLFGGSGSLLGGSPVVASVEDGRRKRPFLTTLDEELQLDDEMYGYYGFDEHAPERKRRLTAEQVVALEQSFEEEKRKLEPERKGELARRLGMAPRQVAVWFQNRRARWKAKQLEHDFHALRAAHDELLAGRDALLADNHRLRSQVTSLTEKLQAKESSPEERTAASDTAQAGEAEATLAVQLKEDYAACAETKSCNGAAAALAGFAWGANDSPESYSYFADTRSPPSSSDDDCAGAVRGELGGCAFFLPDSMLDVAAAERESVGREEDEDAQLNYWAWFWS
ncbi:homeobox-leucine zipper protein HOX25-like [Lolium rigidum]|uniref:homeobox-leucine zipper protein HOX25-like n=1 Tax=Lolium rigidum TaxID=89674 RepID=UPI001F5D1791|nr:homeobox-leucine zipper protein HOX25-like [Lolium rigidum]